MFSGDKDYITLDDLCNILGSAFDMKREDCETLFNLVDKEESGHIKFGKYTNWAYELKIPSPEDLM